MLAGASCHSATSLRRSSTTFSASVCKPSKRHTFYSRHTSGRFIAPRPPGASTFACIAGSCARRAHSCTTPSSCTPSSTLLLATGSFGERGERGLEMGRTQANAGLRSRISRFCARWTTNRITKFLFTIRIARWYFKILEKSRFSNLFIIDPWVFLLYIFFLQFVIQIPTKLSFSATRTKIKIKKSCKRDLFSKQSPSILTLSTSLAPIHPTTGWSNTDLHRFSRCQTGGRFAAVTKYADIIALEDLNEKGATSWSVHDFDLD